MNKDKRIYIVFSMLIIIFALFVCSTVKINKLKHENYFLNASLEEIKAETIELVPCYLCDGTVKIQPVNEVFYIECEDCELRTDYFKSKNKLISYWNKTN